MTRADERLAKKIQREHPELFKRVRAACQYGSIDLDVHAAKVCATVLARRAAA